MKRRCFNGWLLLICAFLFIPGCATLSEFTAQSEKHQQEREKLETEIMRLQSRESELLAQVQNLRLEIEKVSGNEAELRLDLRRLRDEKSLLESKLASSRKHQKEFESELAKSNERLGDIISRRKKELVELDKIRGKFYSALKKYSGVSFEIRDDAVSVILHKALSLKSGKVSVRKEAFALLNELAKVLKSMPGSEIIIEGHTDDIPIKYSYPSNWELSFARAFAVLHYLEGRDVEPARMSAVGCGKFSPADTNTTSAGRAKNRRVEVLILRKK